MTQTAKPAARIRLEWNQPIASTGRTVRNVRDYTPSARGQFLAEIERLRRDGIEFKVAVK